MSDKTNNLTNQNWKELIDLIQDHKWSNEKNLLIKKISDLEREVTNLKQVNNDIAIKINLTPKEINSRSLSNNTNTERKFCNTINDQNKHILDTDKLKKEIIKLSRLKLRLVKQKINSEELKKNRYNRLFYNNKIRKLNSFGGFEKLLENKLNIEVNQHLSSGKIKKDSNFKITMFNNINLHNTNTAKSNTNHTTNTNKKSQQNYKSFVGKDLSLVKNDSELTIIKNKSNESQIYTPKVDNNRLSFVHQPFSHRQIDVKNLRVSIDDEILSTKLFSSSSFKPSCNPITVLKSHMDSVREIAISEDRKYLFSVSEDMLINVWDFKLSLKTGKEIYEPSLTIRGHTKPIFSLTNQYNSNPNFYNFSTGGSDGIIRNWKISSENKDKSNINDKMKLNSCFSWKAHTDSFNKCTFYFKQKKLCSVSSDGTVKIWKGLEDNLLDNLCKNFFLDKVNSYDSWSKIILRTISFKNHNYNLIEIPTSCAWSNFSNHILNISYIAPIIKTYDIESGKSINDISFNVEKNSPYECQQTNKIINHSYTNLLVSAHEDRQIRFFDTKINKCIKSLFAHSDSISSISNGTSEYQILSGCHDGSFRCWDLRKFKLLFDIPAHRKKNDEGCLAINANPINKQIVTCGSDSLIKIFQSN